jgi:hypothetical protein
MLDKIKTKGFWGAIALAVGSFLTGAATAPESLLNLFTTIFGG